MLRMILIGICAALMCGVAVASDVSLPRVGVLSDGISEFWTAMRDTMLDAAVDAGVTVDFRMPSPATVEQQRELARQLLQSGVNVLAVAPVSPEKQGAWINSLAENIAVVTIVRDAPQSKRLAYIGRDEQEVGRMLGRLTLAAVPEGLKVAAFCGLLDAPEIRARSAGLNEVISESSVILEMITSDHGDRMLARANIEDMLRQRPEITCFIGLSDYYGPLLLNAIKEAGRARWVRIISVGSSPLLKTAINEGIVHGLVGDSAEGFAEVTLKTLSALAKEDTTILPENGILMGPTKAIVSETQPNAEEVLDELELQIPWISEIAPDAP